MLGSAGVLFAFAAFGADDADYVQNIKPLLTQRCVKCHNAKTQESGLRLDMGGGLLRGGDGGSIIVAGDAAKSRLIQIVRGNDQDVERMPPEGEPLTDREIAILEAWIAAGANVPREELALVVDSDHWAFQKPLRPALPVTNSTSASYNSIDCFVLAKLESEGVTASPEADRATLIRRLSLDLLGIPPSPEDVTSFVQDERPDAYVRLVERLLASPAYGERWGRHWLDVARYADSNGFTRDFAREMWKYRDWVISAVNAGMPFDQFTIEQFAGDMLPEPTLDQLIATGFHRNTLTNDEGGTDQEQFRVDAVADRVDTTGVAYLGLTLGCARCHQHKYDPISQREYYQLFAFLNNCDEPNIDAPVPWQVADGIVQRRNAIRNQIQQLEAALSSQADEFTKKQLEWEEAITPKFFRTLDGPTQVALERKLEERDDAQKQLIVELYKKSDEARQAFPLVQQIADLRSSEPTIPTAMILREKSEPRITHIHRRGNFLDPGDRVEPRVPTVLHPLQSQTRQSSDDGSPASTVVNSRLDFARWLVDADNPLTPRVTVNRYWQRFFGRGIVETENDFGIQGTPPTHPELLDWLAVEFVESGWDIKAIHRLIVTSATYRQASHYRRELDEIDPANKLLARQSRVRLDAEIIRDNALAVSGLLSRKIGGPSVHPPQPEGIYAFTQDQKPWDTDANEDRFRRGMYTYFWRSSPYPSLMAFDAPEANVTCTRRVRSNTPLQSLTLANDIQFIECARALAEQLLAAGGQNDQDKAELLFQRCFSRRASELEHSRLLDLVAAQRKAYKNDPDAATALVGGEKPTANDVELAAWTAASRVLMNVDEFVTRE
ncbi:MAG: PSD1 domain-containing protein [Planctomycetaceae bacterium]|nr:PSD1 domain-containing protein [Planctomycetales bacterium]MCB9922003.1 PSD1 domain-containing protein [Planctomycetaceae bacterium]